MVGKGSISGIEYRRAFRNRDIGAHRFERGRLARLEEWEMGKISSPEKIS